MPLLSIFTSDAAPPFHAVIIPSNDAKMNEALFPFPIRNPLVPLFTCPVGVPWFSVAFAPGGIVTTIGPVAGKGVPAPFTRVEVPLKVFDTQNGLVGLGDMPQSPFRLGSMLSAAPAVSAVRFF